MLLICFDKVKDKLQKEIFNPKYTKLNHLNINRKFIKRCIMTIPYGVTKRGIANQLKTDHFFNLLELKIRNMHIL